MALKDDIIDFLIIHQPYLKKETDGLKRAKVELLKREMPLFRRDIEEQYDARIKQFIAFYVADNLAIPAEYVIIELEKIEVEDFLNV